MVRSISSQKKTLKNDYIVNKLFYENTRLTKKKKTLAKYFRLYVSVESILLTFPSLYMVEYGFSHVHYLQSKQRNTLNTELADLPLKLTNLQPYIHDLLSPH